MLEVDLQLHLASVVSNGELVADVADGAPAAGLGAGGGCEGADHVVRRVVVVGTRVSHTAIIPTLISTMFFGENVKYLLSSRAFIAVRAPASSARGQMIFYDKINIQKFTL